MPLSEVRPGMQCTSLSVIQGVEPVSFDVEIIDIVEGDPTTDGARILIRVWGPAVDATGLGPGFSGSPIYCRNAAGQAANAGAISESVGEFGGKVGLATPIESILGNPPDAPARASERPAVTRRARPLGGVLTVSGLSRPLAGALTRAAARRGRTIIAAPSGPLRSFPPQVLRPGSAVSTGYSSGDLAIGAVGTVAYVDGDRVWSFGHQLDAAGRRNLLLQDAYVYRVINNPNQAGESASTYKLAAASHDLGRVSNDALTAVVGRVGALPPRIPVRITARDQDTGARQSVDVEVADETDVENPLGTSLISLIGPLAVVQAGSGVLKSFPARVSGDMCAEIALREVPREPLRFCNRYIGDSASVSIDGTGGNALATSAGADVEVALSLIAGYTGKPLHVTSVKAGLRIHRGADLAYMRELELPKRARRGQQITGRLTIQRLRGPKLVRRVELRLPKDLERGSRRIILRGTEPDATEEGFFDTLTFDTGGEEGAGRDGSTLDAGPQSLAELKAAVESLRRFDGVELFIDRARGEGTPVLRDPEMRLAGQVSARVRVR